MGWQGRTVAGIAAGLTVGLLAGAFIWSGGESISQARGGENFLWNQANAQAAGFGQPETQRISLADLKPFPEETKCETPAAKARTVAPLPVRQVGAIPGGLRMPIPKRPEKKASPDIAAAASSKSTVAEKENYSSKISFIGGGNIDFGSVRQGE